MSDFSRKIPVFLHVSKSEFPLRRRFIRKMRPIVPHVLKSDFGLLTCFFPHVTKSDFGLLTRVFLHVSKSDFLLGRRINCQMRPVLLHVTKSDFRAFCRWAVSVRRHAAERQNRPCGGCRLLVGHIGRHFGGRKQPPLPAQRLPGGLQVPAGGVKQRPPAVPQSEGGALSGRQGLHRHRPQQTARHLSGAAPAGDTLPQDVRQRHQSAARMLSRHTRSEGRKVKGSFCWFTSPIL